MNLGARMAAWYGGDLPAGYRKVNYIKTSGSASIGNLFVNKSTGIDFVFDFDIKIDSILSRTYVGEGFTSINRQAFVAYNTSNKLYMCFANNATSSTMIKNLGGLSERHRFVATGKNGTTTYTEDGNQIATFATTSFVVSNFSILSLRDGSSLCTGIQYNYGEKIRLDGVDLYDLVPVVRVSDNKAGFFNRIDKSVLFSTTGTDFEYG